MNKIRFSIVICLSFFILGCQPNIRTIDKIDTHVVENISSSSQESTASQGNMIVYRNTALGFEMEFPSGWYLPRAEDTDPHFYENAECAAEDNPQCAAFEIQASEGELSASDKKTFLDEANNTNNPASLPRRLSFIPEATVVEEELGEGLEGWKYDYGVIFDSNNKKIFGIFSNDKILETSVFPTMRLIK